MTVATNTTVANKGCAVISSYILNAERAGEQGREETLMAAGGGSARNQYTVIRGGTPSKGGGGR